MQHEERLRIIESLVESLSHDLLKEAKKKIRKNPYVAYNEQTILDLMADYGVQRRTAREWLICAQIRFSIAGSKNAKLPRLGR